MMRELERRLNRLEQKQSSGRQGPGVVFLCGVDPVTKERSCDTAIFMGGGENLHRDPGESQEDFEKRVCEAGGTAQVLLPEKELT